MTNTNSPTIEKALQEFEFFWGIAPEGSLKYRKGKDIESFLTAKLKEVYEEGYQFAKNKYKEREAILLKEVEGNAYRKGMRDERKRSEREFLNPMKKKLSQLKREGK